MWLEFAAIRPPQFRSVITLCSIESWWLHLPQCHSGSPKYWYLEAQNLMDKILPKETWSFAPLPKSLDTSWCRRHTNALSSPHDYIPPDSSVVAQILVFSSPINYLSDRFTCRPNSALGVIAPELLYHQTQFPKDLRPSNTNEMSPL